MTPCDPCAGRFHSLKSSVALYIPTLERYRHTLSVITSGTIPHFISTLRMTYSDSCGFPQLGLVSRGGSPGYSGSVASSQGALGKRK